MIPTLETILLMIKCFNIFGLNKPDIGANRHLICSSFTFAIFASALDFAKFPVPDYVNDYLDITEIAIKITQ